MKAQTRKHAYCNFPAVSFAKQVQQVGAVLQRKGRWLKKTRKTETLPVPLRNLAYDNYAGSQLVSAGIIIFQMCTSFQTHLTSDINWGISSKEAAFLSLQKRISND